MRWLVLALVLAHALPAVARAQGEAPAADADVSDEELIRWASAELARHDGRTAGRHPPVPPDPYLRADAEPGDVSLLEGERLELRLLAELGGGALGVLAGGGAGVLLVWAAAESNADPDLFAIAIGAGTILGALGVTAGVTLAADLMGGRGNFGHAFLGQVIGAVCALPMVVIGMENDALPLALVALGVLPLAGAILGYEVGHTEHASTGGAIAFLVPTERGALGGVAGSLP